MISVISSVRHPAGVQTLEKRNPLTEVQFSGGGNINKMGNAMLSDMQLPDK